MPVFPPARVSEVISIVPATAKIFEESNYTVSAGGTYTPINYSGRGKLNELTVISQSNKFKITVEVDGETIWDKSYDDASSVTDDIVYVAAFQREDGKYVYHISDVPFMSNIKVDIVNLDTENSLILDYIFIKYETR